MSPCVLPLLPIIIGGSLTEKSKWRPVIITASLTLSIVLFTLLLKWSTAFIAVPPSTWTTISGGLVLILGLITLFPSAWEKLALKLKLSNRSNALLATSSRRSGALGAVLVGVALGPVFSSCSPTYALILATVLPQSFLVGLANLFAYGIGLAAVLLLVAVFGQRLVSRLTWAADPHGWFKRAVGILFVLVGLAILFGVEKKLETALVERGFGITALEERLVNDMDKDMKQESMKMNSAYPAAPELRGLTGWINSEPLTLAELEGKVVLIDFWTYSCINCIRTLPYLRQWHEEYADDGLVIIGAHAPEFAFERDPDNVRDAVRRYGIGYPVALDNGYETWRAYENRYWPAKYFIDRQGRLRHHHFGEGEYAASEEVIRELLAEGGAPVPGAAVTRDRDEEGFLSRARQTPETYLGHFRAANFASPEGLKRGEEASYSLPELKEDQWALAGQWHSDGEYARAAGPGARLALRFSAKSVYLVMSADEPSQVEVSLNGQPADSVLVEEDRLYQLLELDRFQKSQLLELDIPQGVSAYAFTFGS